MIIHNDLDKFIQIFPDYIKEALQAHVNKSKLVEVVVDLGRRPEGRFLYGTEYLSEKIVSWQDLDFMTKRLGNFSDDNRAGIERTLHRISCIRNREGIVIGLTCRIGRCVIGSIGIIRDLLEASNSLLILGKPGVGKTTLIREISRVLADEVRKRVVIIDTSNEIAGDSDIPHVGIGRARRMQVSKSENQHKVMIEAVENHTPEIIVVDEIGTELESFAARTIAERGVQLVGTAHGNSLENLIKNPTLSDLIGGIQTVTLSDEEARRRGTQKTILERRSLPAFQVAIELNDKNFWTIHERVEDSVDALLKGQQPKFQIRTMVNNRHVKIEYTTLNLPKSSFLKKSYQTKQSLKSLPSKVVSQGKTFTTYSNEVSEPKIKFHTKLKIYTYYISFPQIKSICKTFGILTIFTKVLEDANVIFASKGHFRQNLQLQQRAKEKRIPVYLLTNNRGNQIRRVVKEFIKQKGLKPETKNIKKNM